MKTKVFQVISLLMLTIVLSGAVPQPASASAPAQATAQEQVAAQLPPPVNSQELEAFLDDLLAAQMAENHIPGAVVAVVEDGRLLIEKGYGYANLDNQTVVDPEQTPFHVASISKLFIWTAVMQLVEEGQLSLDSDINEFLDFTIPATFTEPIRLRDLMSHTSGFEDKSLEMWKLHSDEINPLGVYLETNLPARVFPPGELIAYSNYGASLAGYIVERVSGLSFDDYVEKNILEPLGMTRSSYRQPLPPTLAGDLATGYNYSNGQYVAGNPYDQSYPSGSLSATAADMVRFMIAHLQNGELEGNHILQEETAIEMHSQLYAPDPRLDGVAHGFFERTINGQRLLSHGGNFINSNSFLYLIPEQKAGFFISTNSTGGGRAIQPIVDAFIDYRYPAPESPTPHPEAGFAERIAPYLGEYTSARGNFTSFEKINSVFAPLSVGLDGDDNLVVRSHRFAEVGPGLLQDVSDPDNRLVYRTDPDGRLVLTGAMGIYESFADFRTPWYGTGKLHLLVIVSGMLLFLAALIGWPIKYVIERRQGPVVSQPTALPARLARWLVVLFGLLLLLVPLGMATIFANILPGYGVPSIWFETPVSLTILLSISYVLGGLALAIMVFAVVAWVKRYWSLGSRIFYSLLALTALLMTWSLVYWDLLL
jgi:CubicO group peptidase (beta-lactamase class C family)